VVPGWPTSSSHGLRHINISLQLDAGVSETIIAMRVGHTSPSLIRSTHGHLIGTIGKRAAEATASLVSLHRAAKPAKIRKGKRSRPDGDGPSGLLSGIG
jgi:integrase